MLFDAHNHAHLLQPERWSEFFLACKRQGICAMAANSTLLDEYEQLLAFGTRARDFGIQVFAQLGVHPWQLAEWRPPASLQRLEELLKQNANFGVGEIGFDRKRSNPHWQRQLQAFEAQLALATRLDRPVSIHVTGNWEVLFALIEQYQPRRWLVHGFCGSREIAERISQLGGMISIQRLSPDRVSLDVHEEQKLASLLASGKLLFESDFYPQEPKHDGQSTSNTHKHQRPPELRADSNTEQFQASKTEPHLSTIYQASLDFFSLSPQS